MIEYFLVGAALLLILSVIASKISDRFGIPALLLFLVIGMLAGSDGIGGKSFYQKDAPAHATGLIRTAKISSRCVKQRSSARSQPVSSSRTAPESK